MVETISISPMLREIGARIRHLNVVFRIDVDRTGHCSFGHVLFNNIQGTRSLKDPFPNLATCVFTVDIRHKQASNANLGLPLSLFELQAIQKMLISRQLNQLEARLAELFGALAEKRPGRSQFVRFQYSRGAPMGSRTKTIHYGPLVKVERSETRAESLDISLGLRLLCAAYRLERVGTRMAPH